MNVNGYALVGLGVVALCAAFYLFKTNRDGCGKLTGYNSWKNLFGRQVARGAKGIKVLAPSPYKIKKEIDKIDPKTQKPVTDKNGNPVKEETEITVPAFKVVSVFDVSQTEGKELPSIGVDERAFKSMSCSLACAVSCISVLMFCNSLMPSLMAMRLSVWE